MQAQAHQRCAPPSFAAAPAAAAAHTARWLLCGTRALGSRRCRCWQARYCPGLQYHPHPRCRCRRCCSPAAALRHASHCCCCWARCWAPRWARCCQLAPAAGWCLVGCQAGCAGPPDAAQAALEARLWPAHCRFRAPGCLQGLTRAAAGESTCKRTAEAAHVTSCATAWLPKQPATSPPPARRGPAQCNTKQPPKHTHTEHDVSSSMQQVVAWGQRCRAFSSDMAHLAAKSPPERPPAFCRSRA